MLKEKLKDRHIILASGSPRRQQFFRDLDLDFEVRIKSIKEEYPKTLLHYQITDYLAELKSLPFIEALKPHEILVTSDTIVWHKSKALGKPKNNDEAFEMLNSLSNTTHEVITSVCIRTKNFQKTVNAVTKVTFKKFTDDELWHYILTYAPLDKAGAYGIQEWIGQIGVTSIEGSFFNVVGMPTHLVYETLNSIAEDF
ncbi:Maf family nucleotide pyrophosphatase [Psychroserpens sp. NJDZ02]|uniref:Maf family nucleotide pyrophosphatase n=1 Tax=Psychroserpens sp. NJDZ02 TaxID=2570561 RepID=UPI0010A8DA80|nr:Maf family nucleotide pyrophosphatase [Psychroserpens sp. NJDZ02]QCE42261.1 septum formation protein Maf [Psychroserpens sp. NJDZ02]